MRHMDIELEAEVSEWYVSLQFDEQDIVAVHIELLEEFGHLLRMPHSKPLGDGLFELRFTMGRRAWRITYWQRPDGVIVLLTVFHKQRNNERREIARASAALESCKNLHSTP
jgi:putative component of toxin-antitoxin plasmid stabilization module